MTQEDTAAPFDWDRIRLAVFDVDGTLYRQSPLRMRMARDMLAQAARTRSWRHVAVLRAYRHIRETLGDQEVDEFDRVLIARTAQATATPPEDVRATVAEWMEDRPLRYVKLSRFPAIEHLFDGLRAHGKAIGILSDYPVAAKLAAMELAADHIACAGDAHIGILKPHPRGLQSVIAAAGVRPDETVLIGDRADRDGAAARRAGAHALIKAKEPIEGWRTFRHFDDTLFAPILGR